MLYQVGSKPIRLSTSYRVNIAFKFIFVPKTINVDLGVLDCNEPTMVLTILWNYLFFKKPDPSRLKRTLKQQNDAANKEISNMFPIDLIIIKSMMFPHPKPSLD